MSRGQATKVIQRHSRLATLAPGHLAQCKRRNPHFCHAPQVKVFPPLRQSMLCFSTASQGRCCCCCCRRCRALFGTSLHSHPGQAPQRCRNAPVFPGGDIPRNVNKSGATSLKSAVPAEETRGCLLRKHSHAHLVCLPRHRQQMWRRGEIERHKSGHEGDEGLTAQAITAAADIKQVQCGQAA